MSQKIKFSRKIVREVFIFIVIYAAWSFYIDIKNPYANLDNEAIVPCLFFLPPIGLYVLYFAVIRYGIIKAILFLIKMKK